MAVTYSINKFQFIPMRAKATSPSSRPPHDATRGHPKPKREFVVEQHRKQFDDYMLSQVRRNRKSVKRVKRAVEQLRSQMDELITQNKRQRNDYELLNHQLKTVKRQLSEPRLELTARRSPKGSAINSQLQKTRKQLTASRESSFSVRSSGMEAPKGKSVSSKGKSHLSKQDSSSKTVLKRKIEDLKERAHLIKQNAAQIQQQIHRKMEQKQQLSPSKHEHHPHEDNNDTKAYEELMELLRTNKRIQEAEPIVHQPLQSKQELSINEEVHMPYCSDKSMLSTNRDPTPLKNSAAVSYYDPKPSPLNSETNLLDSDKHISMQPKRALKLNRCVDVQIHEECQPVSEEGGEFQCLLREARSSGSQLSFQGPGNEQQLKELQFEFDQLVRQELMSNEPKEKEALGKTIRSLLERIANLRQQLQQNS